MSLRRQATRSNPHAHEIAECHANDLITPQHTINQITKRPPVIFPTGQLVFINEQHVVFEAGVQVRLETEVYDNRVVVTVDMSVHTVQALEDLTNETREGLGERDT